jgi:probable HAF family extracellular repeat protein
MTRAGRLILSLVLLAPTLAVRASDKPLVIELEPRSQAVPYGVNATGTVVVGQFYGSGSLGAFYWMPTTGVIFNGGWYANDVSRDGRTIVGAARDSRGILQAAIWVRAAEWRLLGSFTPSAAPCGASLSGANGTSADGRVVVGYASNGCERDAHAFRWEESTGMVDLGSSVAGAHSWAGRVSGDGKVVVGHQERSDSFLQGARWVDGRQELIPGPVGFVGTARNTNADGSIVVGSICSPGAKPTDPNDQSAWVWTAREGTQCLPPPARRPSPGEVVANATSDDGRIIGGGQRVGVTAYSDAILWIDRTPHYLKDYLRANGVPDAFERLIYTGEIEDVSPDGRILVGGGSAIDGVRGYIVILGEKP